MRRRYRLKKKYSIRALIIILMIIGILIVMNVGYSLWSTKLNIYGKVTLDFDPPPLEITAVPNGNNEYISGSGFQVGMFKVLDFISDEYSGNSLITTLRVHENYGMAYFATDLAVRFTLKNTSSEGYVYTDGEVTQLEVSNPDRAVTNVSASILPNTISSGGTADFNFSARLDRRDMRQDVYYKYAITFNVNGVKKYFFYTIKILA